MNLELLNLKYKQKKEILELGKQNDSIYFKD